MIVHCGSIEDAKKFLAKWSNRTRGPIPRAASGLAESYILGYDQWISTSVILNCEPENYDFKVIEGMIKLLRVAKLSSDDKVTDSEQSGRRIDHRGEVCAVAVQSEHLKRTSVTSRGAMRSKRQRVPKKKTFVSSQINN